MYVTYISIYEDSIIKPTKYCLKREKEESSGSITEVMNLFKYSVCIYGNITMKPICTSNNKKEWAKKGRN
jgi:hypothetical protein